MVDVHGMVRRLVEPVQDTDLAACRSRCREHGKGEGLLIRKGEIVRKMPEGELLDALRKELEQMVRE